MILLVVVEFNFVILVVSVDFLTVSYDFNEASQYLYEVVELVLFKFLLEFLVVDLYVL